MLVSAAGWFIIARRISDLSTASVVLTRPRPSTRFLTIRPFSDPARLSAPSPHPHPVLTARGDNDYGQAGPGTDSDCNCRKSPTVVPGVTNAKWVQSLFRVTCAYTNDDKLFCWGVNAAGNLQAGTDAAVVPTSSSTSTPVEMTRLAGAQQIAIGMSHICALYSGGTLRCS